MKAKSGFWIMLVSLAVLIVSCRFSNGSPGSPPDAVFADATSVFTRTETPQNAPMSDAITDTPLPILPTGTEVTVNTPIATEPNAFTATVEVRSSELPEQTPTFEPNPVATNTPVGIQSPTQTPLSSTKTSPLDSATVRLVDNFESGGGWAQAAIEGQYEFGYTEGVFRFDISVPDIDVWSVRSQAYSNLRQEITISAMSGDEDGYFGIMCRWEKPNSYYRFTVTPGGNFKITKIFLGIETDLAETNMTPFSNFGNEEIYRIRTDCTGSTLLFYLNQQLVLSAEDNDIFTGKFGMIAEAGQSGSIQIDVDNYALYVP